MKSFRERDKALNEACQRATAARRDAGSIGARIALVARGAGAGESIVAGAQADIRRAEDELAAIDRFRRNYLTQLRVFVERQLAEINAAEAAPTIQRTRGE